MKLKLKQSLAGIIMVSLIAGILLATNENKLKSLLVHYNIIRIEQHASYLSLPYEQQVKNADIIFAGRLIEISPSKWNQDNSEYWEKTSSEQPSSLQYHTLKFDISEFIVDKIQQKDQSYLEVTILGASPLDGNADYSLAIGDNVIGFAKRADLAWKDGNKTVSIIEVVTAPSLAFFVQSGDPSGFYEGKVLYDLGKGNFETRNISLPLQDIASQVQSIIQNQPPSRP